ncbi:NIPSNAP family protein [Nocardioides lijunqiniae]|uniref:NIPSNAP family protein n=1 Tax=Nocardioides lijunqiniae TaxID=2760832 RepID=UPI001877ACA2|nr:NIPSNAP family protein [Nocardioides lijunqiniae]
MTTSDIGVVELRQYTLHPGRRDEIVELFDAELVETQEACGMRVLGQLLDLERPDRFVWLRGFADMEARRRALESFYGGPVWGRHAEAANATMAEFHDVYLLAPVGGIDLAPSRATHSGATRELSVTVYDGRPDLPRGEALAVLTGLDAPNTYPALPLRPDGDVTVRIEPGTAPAGPVRQAVRARPTDRSLLR